MGIKNLKGFIKKNAPGAFSEINIKKLSGSTICIDSSILLYKFRYMYNSDNFHILGFLNKVIELLSYRIIPVFVFDGKPPEAKRETLIKRTENKNKLKERIDTLLKEREIAGGPEFIDSDSEIENNSDALDREISQLQKNLLCVTKKHTEEVMVFLKSIGIPVVLAISEAEEYCAFLEKNKYVDYILTEDSDSLTFGGNKVLFNIPKDRRNFCLCNLQLILKELNLKYCEFIDFCILCGCDYTCKIPKVGPVAALNIIKAHGSIEVFILKNTKYNIPENFNYLVARELFNKNDSYPKLSYELNTFGRFDTNLFGKLISEYGINNLNYENKIINLINLFPKKFLE
jgi:flap endonuclease-1